MGGNGGGEGKVVVRIREGVAVAMLDRSGPQVNVIPLLGEWRTCDVVDTPPQIRLDQSS